jgi:hypothetical protein
VVDHSSAGSLFKSEFHGIGGLQTNISVNRICTLYARCAPSSGATTQGNRTMTKNLALAASMVVLTAISGQAFAKTAAPSDQQAAYAFNASDRATATEMNAPDAYHYHGGPKYND